MSIREFSFSTRVILFDLIIGKNAGEPIIRMYLFINLLFYP